MSRKRAMIAGATYILNKASAPTCTGVYILIKKTRHKIAGLSFLMCIVMSLSFGWTPEATKKLFSKPNANLESG